MKIFIPENNLANEASHLAHMIRRRKDVRIYSEKNDRVGVRKGPDTADNFQYLINVKMRAGAIRFDNEFFTTSKGHTTSSMRGLFKEELQRYHVEYEEKSDGEYKMKITGKGSNGENDDLVIAFAMALSHGRDIMMNPRRMF